MPLSSATNSHKPYNYETKQIMKPKSRCRSDCICFVFDFLMDKEKHRLITLYRFLHSPQRSWHGRGKYSKNTKHSRLKKARYIHLKVH